MRCPKCGVDNDKVIDSRSIREGAAVRRRRECLGCGSRFSTIEGIIPEELKVIKRNGEREDYERGKVRCGIVNACYKRNISADDIDRMVENVTSSLLRDFEKEVPSAEIGRRVMTQLKEIDQVAYVRFASVYRKFKAVEEFIDEIRSLQ